MENTAPQPNPIAAAAVESAQQPNSNGIPGSLPGETREETQARLYKVQVDGQELEVDENELKKGYAHAKAAAKRMQEAAQAKKEAAAIMRMFKENPTLAMSKLGLDPRQFAQSVIDRELQEAMLSPEQKELRAYKEKVSRYEAEQRRAKEEYEKQVMEQEFARQTEQIQNDIISVLETSGLPKNAKTVSRMAYYMQAAMNAGHNVGPKDVIEYVKEDYRHDLRSFLGEVPEEALETFLGDELIRRINKSMLKNVKSTAPQVTPKDVNKNIKKRDDQKKIRSPRDFFGI